MLRTNKLEAVTGERNRRGRIELYGDILLTLKAEKSQPNTDGRVRWSRIQSAVFVPTKRFKRYLEEMALLGMISLEDGAVLPPGEAYASAYGRLVGVLAEPSSAADGHGNPRSVAGPGPRVPTAHPEPDSRGGVRVP